jgi:hypothetical protein
VHPDDSVRRLATVFGALAGAPRVVVAGGNVATPWRAPEMPDSAVAEYAARIFGEHDTRPGE